ncbi:hypothetical protein IW140_004255 [Coemansia sp. RSA 1813]|nr:hypothetical protein LPJ74_003149 [Coemansia sp. RSA 1843]KAJ2212180.1 hypothetical protein EV179_004869 [Coemansia sp. RSA 487]KAJ2568010.1 hypothetical protein IW140_004255 [Coemansia sp. RSA 1813]
MQQSYTGASGGHTRRKSSFAMNVDTPPSAEHHQQQNCQNLGTFQNTQQYTPIQGDYYPYATTTVQMVDPWAFNHANLLANLSQLPPDLLPSIMSQANQQQQQHQNGSQNMSVLAAANQQIPQPQMHATDNSNHNFTVPGSLVHHRHQQHYQNQHGSNAIANSDNNSGGNSNVVLPSISTLPYPTANSNQPLLNGHQQQQQQQQNPYGYNVYYNPSTLQPLMIPPPSPTILSYYKTDPARWMSLLGQHAYQPQAYHYDYPPPPHQLSYGMGTNQQQQQQQLSSAYGNAGTPYGNDAVNGSMMLLAQQFVPPQQNQIAAVSLPPIDQAIHQNNVAVAAAAAAQLAAAAAASAQYTQPVATNHNASSVAFGVPQSQMPFESRHGAPAYLASHLTQQQPTRRSSSFTNLALLQQQQSNSPLTNSFANLGCGYGAQLLQKPDSAPSTGPHGSAFSGFNKPATLQDSQYSSHQQQQQQQQQFGSSAEKYNSSHGNYGSGLFGSSNMMQNPVTGSRAHAGLSSLARMSLASKGRQGFSSLFGGPKPAPVANNSSVPGFGLSPSTYMGQAALSNAASSALGSASSTDALSGAQINQQLATPESIRDRLLQTAHQLYSANPRNPKLIQMLVSLHQQHQQHLPTLLLLACVYFSNNQPELSLKYNELILKIDPNYVEAMSNIGTTLRSMGKPAEAESWWWRAVQLRPGYWDAVENLMGVLCNANQSAASPKSHGSGHVLGKQQSARRGPRYREALQLCEFVDKSLRVGEEPSRNNTGTITKYQVQDKQLSRLQSLLYSEGNLRFALNDISGSRREYEKAMGVVLGGYTLDEVIVRIAYIGAQEGTNQMFHQHLNNQQPPSHNLNINNLPLTLLAPENAVRILQFIFPETQGVLPGFVTLSNKIAAMGANGTMTNQLQQANQVASNLLLTLAKMHQEHAMVAQPLSIVLPLYYLSLSLWPSPSTCNNLGIILSAIPSPSAPTMVPSLQGGQQPAQAPMGSALAMQYYTHGLKLDDQHPHLYTNLGSLLKDLGYLPEAVFMYKKAVEYNPTFDVALANLGNAIKDMGRVQDSVEWYLQAVQASPNFVEAVCGLANAMAGVCDWRARDGLYTEIAVRWNAVALANDEMAVKIFYVMSRGRRPTAKEFVNKLRKLINFVPAPSSPRGAIGGVVDKRRGWMNRVVEIVDQQLSDGRQWSHGQLLSRVSASAVAGEEIAAGARSNSSSSSSSKVLRPTSSLLWFLDKLCQLLPKHSLAPLSSLVVYVHEAQALCQKVASMADACDSYDGDDTLEKWACFARQLRNEGGWALRLVERAMVVLQRQWYWDVQHNKPSAIEALSNPHNSIYKRPKLPTGMIAPAVPTVLPFHTFTYPLDSREIRLISHRNAMRVSFTTLSGSAPWLPAHIYAPPPPPDPLLRIGYVSSDFNNHPLSHLMQSVFGMHDRTRFRVYCYATTPPDGTAHRQKIESEADVFLNCSAWSTQRIVEQIANDKIHVLVNLNGYTKGARNEIFAARPAPVLVAFMGFAGTLGAGWCDYVVTDPIVCPPWTVRCEVRAERRRRAALRFSGNSETKRRQPEMQEIHQSTTSSREMAERGSKSNISSNSNGHAAADTNRQWSADYDSESDNDDDNEVDESAMLEEGGMAAMSRAQRQKEWGGDLPWDFGELDPEEDGTFTGELFSFDADETAADGGGIEAAISHSGFNFIDKIADKRKDEAGALDWVYTERMIYMPHTYFVNDHKQGFREDEELRGIQSVNNLWVAEQDVRYKMRRELFPQLSDDVFIFANFNQLYKIDPTLFRMWLRILERVPNAIIWLLRFPAAGEEHLHRAAVEWAGEEVAQRVVFTDVAPKHVHIKRGRIADAFLDTPECNAHTTAVDILWSGTPVLTWPRHEHKLCSRVAASVVCATGLGRQMVVSGADEYIERAVEWATQSSYEYEYAVPIPGQPLILSDDPQSGYFQRRLCHGPVMDMRMQLFLMRDKSRLFDTLRWTRNLERGLAEAWRRWVTGEDEVEVDGSSNGGASGGSHHFHKPDTQHLQSKSDRRKARWCKRIEHQMDETLSAAKQRQPVYAPPGRCIWVIDEDDANPSHTWVREMIGW